MIGTVITPLDGSELAERALVYSTGIAEKIEAPHRLIRVVSENAAESVEREAKEYLRRIGRELPGRVQFEVIRGVPAEAIRDTCDHVGDALIVMSTHGRGGLRRWVTGSVADEVVRRSNRPVLLVRSGAELPSRLEMHAIMVPVDGSTYSEEALEHAMQLAKPFNSQIHLVRVVDTPSAYAMLSRHMETAVSGNILDEIIETMTREAHESIQQLEKRVRDRGLRVSSKVLDGYPGEQLIAYERSGHFQLVVMATSGRSGVKRVVFGSVAERVLKEGRSPVMMIRPDQSGPAS